MNASSTRPTGMQRLSVKVIAWLCTTLLVVLVLAMAMVSRIIWLDFYQTAEQASTAAAESARSVASSYMESAQLAAEKDFGFFRHKFAGQTFRLSAPQAQSEPLASKETRLLWGESVLNSQFGIVDAFTAETGGAVATVFQRQGEDFLRITTSLKNAQGERAFGTLLDRAHPAYPLMLRGEKYVGPATLFGRNYMTVYEPIKDNNQVIGILFTGHPTDDYFARIRSVMANTRVGETGRVFAVNVTQGAQRGALFGLDDAAARIDFENPPARAWFEAVAAVEDVQELHPTWSPVLQGLTTGERFVGAARLPALGWVVVSDVNSAEMLAAAKHALVFMWSGVAVALLVLSLTVSWTINRFVVRPVAKLSSSLTVLGQGDLTQPISSSSKDEIGVLSADMDRFRQTLLDSMLQIRRGADMVASASQEIASGNDDLSQRTERQASALEETAASMEEMASTVQHNADNATAANQLAAAASAVAERGGQAVSDVVSSMHSMRHSSQKMADIITVIDGIAFQTNILALNAAVEAARAGEQGRGFAVVAGEVRTLAQRSAAAAKEIKALIDESVTKVGQGSAQADQAGATMQEVVGSIRRAADIIGEISAASREQSEGVNQVGEAVMQLDQTTQQNAALVEEMAAAANSLSQQSAEMVNAIAHFRLGHDDGARSAPHSATAGRAATHRAAPVAPARQPAKRQAPAPRAQPPVQAKLQRPAPAPAPARPVAALADAARPAARPEATASADDWTSF